MRKDFSFAGMVSSFSRLWVPLFFLLTMLSACETIDLYEKNVPIPGHQWESGFKPEFHFTISDTSIPYQLFVVIRHNERYGWNNLWLNLQATMPDGNNQVFRLELPLATNEQGWLGIAMDDIYEHRIPLALDPQKFNFQRPGNYKFVLQHIMREDPLHHIMNVGIRLEKKPG